MTLARWLNETALVMPDAPAIMIGQTVVSDYRAFARDAAALAGALLDRRGLACQPGDRVAIIANNSADYLRALYGIWWAGLCAVPINAKLHGAEIGWILENSGASVAFVSARLDTVVSAHAPENLQAIITLGSPQFQNLMQVETVPFVQNSEDDLAWLFYTSGTTGRPKGAMLSHGNVAACALGYLIDVDPTHPGDTLLHAAPMSHGSGLYIPPTIARGGINMVPESGQFDPAETLELMAAQSGTSMFAAPTMIKRLTATQLDVPPDHIRTIIWGGAPMHVADTIAALDRFGPVFAQIYGQGETPMTATVLSKADITNRAHEDWHHRLATAGLPNIITDVRIADADGTTLPTGETGEIVVRGRSVMAGYWQNPEATAQSLRDGWLFTGDVGVQDEAGYITLKDRSKDLIISGGSNIYPREVEEVLLRHPDVAEVSVIGRPDPEWGEVVVAYVSGKASAEALDALCLDAIARFKRPKDYVFVDALPKNNYGKILKTDLRAQDKSRQGENR